MDQIEKQIIFVFGSNLLGIHGAGSAAEAYHNHGAKWGKGVGFCGNSYAIPTKDHALGILALSSIKTFVDQFKRFAEKHPEMEFHVVRIGCGLARYKDEQIAPLFKGSPSNCKFAKEWEPYL